MIATIENQTYDTDSADMIARKTSGWYGDPYGFEEMLFRKGAEGFFLFAQGGSDSIYPAPAIIPLSIDDARNWLSDVVGQDAAQQICEPVVLWNEDARRRAAERMLSTPPKPTGMAAESVESTAEEPPAKASRNRTAKPAPARSATAKPTTARSATAKSGTAKPGTAKPGTARTTKKAAGDSAEKVARSKSAKPEKNPTDK